MGVYGDYFYNSDKDYLMLFTNLKSDLSNSSICFDFDEGNLINLFVPMTSLNYSYVIPGFSDDGIDIPLEIQKQYDIKLYWMIR